MTAPAQAVDAPRLSLSRLFGREDQLRRRTLMVLGLIVVVSAVLGVFVGPQSISPWRVIAALFGEGDLNRMEQAILWEIRLPRVVLGLLVGASLAVCGASMQAILRNPLADPGLIGISSGGSLAAAAVIVLGGTVLSPVVAVLGSLALPVAAFVGSLSAMLIVIAIGQSGGQPDPLRLILAGVAVSALAGAGLGMLTVIGTDQQIRTFTFWTLGSLGRALWDSLWPVAVIICLALPLQLRAARALDAHALGHREAEHLGVNVKGLRWMVILTTALMVGAAVSISGTIGFVGLVVPHLIRLMVGSQNRLVLPASALTGAALMVMADLIARIIMPPQELPIGVLMSGLGAPFFIWLLSRVPRL